MKTRLFLLVIVLIFGLGVKASELPESVSVLVEYIGNTGTGDDERTFELTDEDMDGVYTADLSLGGRIDPLSLLITTVGKDGKTNKWGSSGSRLPMLFGDVPYEVDLVCENESENIRINEAAEFQNWKGGDLKISVKWDNFVNGIHYPLLTVVGVGQPDFGVFPENLYLIGDFNDFKLPDSSGNNGAIELPHQPGARTFRYEGSLYVEAGKGDFLIYIPEFGKGKNCFEGIASPVLYTLYRTPDAPQGFFTDDLETLESLVAGSVPQDGHIRIKDWPGGEMNIYVDFECASYIAVSSKDAPVLEIPSTVRTFIKTNGMADSEQGFFSPYANDFTSCESWLSLTGDENPSSDDMWGYPADEVIDLSPSISLMMGNWRVPIVKGGYPLKFTCSKAKLASLSVYYDVYGGYARIGVAAESFVNIVEADNFKITNGLIVFDAPTEMAVYSVTGVCMANCRTDRFDLGKLPKGIYVVTAGGKTVKVAI